ncbi:uncharacterized protein LOC110465734 isoform X1 [Mizuhopecten yessoensis]|uniref:uncharacterized protein LOC110465734 isoform X1 n=1 Tax=Mizuhopecten yessoensis TaxID=6573 RepID=UPI000B458BB2|nr:uncharacterized protein LOC110465734 isoform X1 [Mizuhopecten yessoensis]
MGSVLTRSKDKNNKMPRSKRNTTKSSAPVVTEEVPATRRTRGAAAPPTVETPSPKKTRKSSPSPSPAPRGRSRGRSTKEAETKQEKGQGDDVEEPSPKKGRVTRAVVQQEEAPSRGRASSRKAAEPKKTAPSPTPKGRSSSRQKAVPTPTKAEEPKAETSRSRSRSKPTKPEPKTPEPKTAKAKSQTRKTPAKKATPSPRKTPVKPEPSPKPAASRSRSRGKKDDKANDLPSAQLILTKIDSPSKSNNTSFAENEEETILPSRSRGQSSAKTSPPKASPKESRRSKSSEKSTPPTRRSRRSVEAEEEAEEKVKEMESEEKEEETKDKERVLQTEQIEKAEAVKKSTESEEENRDEDMDAKDTAAEMEDVVEEKESDDVKEKENDVEEEENEEAAEKKDEVMKEEEGKDGKEEENEEVKMGETKVADVVETDERQGQEEKMEEEMEEEESKDKPKSCEPDQESTTLEPTLPLKPSPVKESSAPAAEECKPPEIEAISDDDVEKEEPMDEDVVEVQENEASEDTAVAPAVTEPVAAQVEMVQEVPKPAIADGEQQNGSPGDPLSSPSRKRKWDDFDDEGEDLAPKKARRSIDMADVTSEGVVTTNGENQMSKQMAEEESTEATLDQKAQDPEVEPTSSDTASQNIEKEYVVVNMDEIPAANSTEVLQCLPTDLPKEEAVAPALAAEQSQSIAPPSEVVSDVNQEQTTAAVTSPSSEFNPVLSRKYIPNPSYHLTGDSNKQFSVVSYNILAQCHLERNDYSFTESQYLEESYRHQNLMKEIKYLNADLVCMQEVGPLYYESLLKPAMSRLGYEGLMKKRTQEYFNEGEATFYKTDRFSAVETCTYSLKDLAEQELEDGGVSEEVKVSIRKYLNLPDVLVLTKLRCNVTGNVLCMGNIHVQWGKMEIPDAQCIQIVCAIKELAKQGGSDCHAQILCGDFNSEATSPGYKLAMGGYLTDEVLKQLQALENLEMTDSSKAALVNHLWRAFQHTSDMKSAYQSAQGCEPVVTSFNRVMLAAVDYIFYCGSNLHNVGVLQTANEEHIKATGGIPDQLFPSDHISLKAVFAFS